MWSLPNETQEPVLAEEFIWWPIYDIWESIALT